MFESVRWPTLSWCNSLLDLCEPMMFCVSSCLFNVLCEGVGRTLEGRDLSKVRNAIIFSYMVLFISEWEPSRLELL